MRALQFFVAVFVIAFAVTGCNSKPAGPRNRTNGMTTQEIEKEVVGPTKGPEFVDGTAALDLKWEPPVIHKGTWSQWRGPRQDGISREPGLLAKWPKEGPQLAWSVPSGEGFATVAVCDGRVFVFDQQNKKEGIRCLDAKSGAPIWNVEFEQQFLEGNGNGPRATPAIYEGKLYAISGSGIVHCLNAADGALIWTCDFVKDFEGRAPSWGYSASPVIHAGRVYVLPGGAKGSAVAALDANTGNVIWKGFNDIPGCASPVLFSLGNRNYVLFFTAEGLLGVTADAGTEMFRVKWTTGFNANLATPIVMHRHVFISTAYDVGCALIEMTPKEDKIETKVVYRNKQFKNHFATSVVSDGHLYGFDDNFLSCLDLSTGKRKWKERGFEKGTLTVADGRLIILGEQGKLALANLDSKKYVEISSCKPLEGKCWTVPVVADGRLYVRNEKILKCFILKSN